MKLFQITNGQIYINFKEALFWTIITLSIVFFILGITFPLFTTTKLVFFESEFNFFSSLKLFLDLEEYFLFVIILSFTLIFPTSKYLLLILARLLEIKKITIVVHKLAKWSMLDVYVVAIMLLVLKIEGGIVAFNIQIGTYFLTISIILSLLLGLLGDKETKPTIED
jgi:uncharacterized paraquat-inducible protein A